MVKDVRAALVQLFNCKVTEEFVTEVLEQESLSRAIKSFDFEDFSRIYYRFVPLLYILSFINSAFRAVSMRPEVADGLVEESTHELQSPIQLEEETSTTFTSLPVGSGMQVARKIVIDK